jgi:cellobiose-specific phosphotransferase system component IIA
MNELMQQWKASGTAGKETDDELWDAFNAARQKFFDRKHEHWENLQTKFSNAKEIKEGLIKEAAALADSVEWNKTGEKFRAMMDQWKAAGSAGREHEDRLWNAFNESRQKFYDRRGEYYDQLHEQQDGKYEEKRRLVEQANEIAQRGEYTREHTDVMKNLSKEWKSIGSCGREREDDIWKEFRTAMDSYFEGLRNWNEQRHAQWRQRIQEARARKQELILDQQRQIKRMQNDIIGLIGERAINDMEEQIADKKEFIRELEEELADIDKTLAK